jgi:uncharacterized membrane protein
MEASSRVVVAVRAVEMGRSRVLALDWLRGLVMVLMTLWSAALPGWAAAVLPPLGQNAFFFYLLHIHLLKLAAWLLALSHGAGLAATYLSAAVVIAVLIPPCQRFRRYKVGHPASWAQYI